MRSATAGALLCAVLLGGCSAVPSPQPQPADSPQFVPQTPALLGRQIADAALLLRGRPYEYGGNGPGTFDCSGLVSFVHSRFGIATPRTTAAQFRASRPVAREAIAAGDLLFFRIAETVSHVAIYAGDGRFIHAPQSGRPVETRSIDDPYYRIRLVKIGRLY